MTPRRIRSESGMTIIEVMVAAAVLTIGLLGAAQLLITANKSTNASSARSGANNVARRLAEAARSVGARDLTPSTVTASLKTAAPDLADSDTTDTAWTVVRRNFVYTLTASECTLDDRSDGVAPASQKDSTYCANTTAATTDSQPADARQVTVQVTYKLKG